MFINRRKLRRYTAIAAATKSEAIKSAVQIPLTRDVESQRSSQIPFGVRAIQSGIEVEGVWISRPSSLAPSDSRHGSQTSLSAMMANSPLTQSPLLAPPTVSSKRCRKAVNSSSSIYSPIAFDQSTPTGQVRSASEASNQQTVAGQAESSVQGAMLAETAVRGRPRTVDIPNGTSRAPSKSSVRLLPSSKLTRPFGLSQANDKIVKGSVEDLRLSQKDHTQSGSDKGDTPAKDFEHSFYATRRQRPLFTTSDSSDSPALSGPDNGGDLSLAHHLRFEDTYLSKRRRSANRSSSTTAQKPRPGPSILRSSYLAVNSHDTTESEDEEDMNASKAAPSLSHTDSPDTTSISTTREASFTALPQHSGPSPSASIQSHQDSINEPSTRASSGSSKTSATLLGPVRDGFVHKGSDDQVLRRVNSGFEILRPQPSTTDKVEPHKPHVTSHAVQDGDGRTLSQPNASELPIVKKRTPRKLQKKRDPSSSGRSGNNDRKLDPSGNHAGKGRAEQGRAAS